MTCDTVTNLADAGVDTETIMKIVGHSSVEVFLRYRTVKAERLDSTIINTHVTPAKSQIAKSLTN